MVVLEIAWAASLYFAASIWEHSEKASQSNNVKSKLDDNTQHGNTVEASLVSTIEEDVHEGSSHEGSSHGEGSNSSISTKSYLPSSTDKSQDNDCPLPLAIYDFETTSVVLQQEQLQQNKHSEVVDRDVIMHDTLTNEEENSPEIESPLEELRNKDNVQEVSDHHALKVEHQDHKEPFQQEILQEVGKAREKDNNSTQLYESPSKSAGRKRLKSSIKKRVQKAKLKMAQKEAQQDAQKIENFVLAMKVIKVKAVTGPLAVKMPLAKTSPFFEIDRVNTTKVDKKGRLITEFVFRSDYIVDDDSPQWQPVMLDAEYLCNNNRNHPIVIRVKDYDESGNHLYIGEFQTTFNELINSVTTADDEDSAKVIKLKKDGKTSGKIVVTSARVEKIVPTKKAVSGWLKLNLKGERFKNFDGVLSKSDPFFEVSRIDKGTGKPILVYRSPYVKSNLWPDWKESRIRMDKLFADGMDQVIHFDVYDHDKKGSHEFMGGFETTMEGLVKSSETGVPFEMLSRKSKPKGTIFVEMVEVVDQQDGS